MTLKQHLDSIQKQMEINRQAFKKNKENINQLSNTPCTIKSNADLNDIKNILKENLKALSTHKSASSQAYQCVIKQLKLLLKQAWTKNEFLYRDRGEILKQNEKLKQKIKQITIQLQENRKTLCEMKMNGQMNGDRVRGLYQNGNIFSILDMNLISNNSSIRLNNNDNVVNNQVGEQQSRLLLQSSEEKEEESLLLRQGSNQRLDQNINTAKQYEQMGSNRNYNNNKRKNRNHNNQRQQQEQQHNHYISTSSVSEINQTPNYNYRQATFNNGNNLLNPRTHNNNSGKYQCSHELEQFQFHDGHSNSINSNRYGKNELRHFVDVGSEFISYANSFNNSENMNWKDRQLVVKKLNQSQQREYQMSELYLPINQDKILLKQEIETFKEHLMMKSNNNKSQQANHHNIDSDDKNQSQLQSPYQQQLIIKHHQQSYQLQNQHISQSLNVIQTQQCVARCSSECQEGIYRSFYLSLLRFPIYRQKLFQLLRQLEEDEQFVIYKPYPMNHFWVDLLSKFLQMCENKKSQPQFILEHLNKFKLLDTLLIRVLKSRVEFLYSGDDDLQEEKNGIDESEIRGESVMGDESRGEVLLLSDSPLVDNDKNNQSRSQSKHHQQHPQQANISLQNIGQFVSHQNQNCDNKIGQSYQSRKIIQKVNNGLSPFEIFNPLANSFDLVCEVRDNLFVFYSSEDAQLHQYTINTNNHHQPQQQMAVFTIESYHQSLQFVFSFRLYYQRSQPVTEERLYQQQQSSSMIYNQQQQQGRNVVKEKKMCNQQRYQQKKSRQLIQQEQNGWRENSVKRQFMDISLDPPRQREVPLIIKGQYQDDSNEKCYHEESYYNVDVSWRDRYDIDNSNSDRKNGLDYESNLLNSGEGFEFSANKCSGGNNINKSNNNNNNKNNIKRQNNINNEIRIQLQQQQQQQQQEYQQQKSSNCSFISQTNYIQDSDHNHSYYNQSQQKGNHYSIKQHNQVSGSNNNYTNKNNNSNIGKVPTQKQTKDNLYLRELRQRKTAHVYNNTLTHQPIVQLDCQQFKEQKRNFYGQKLNNTKISHQVNNKENAINRNGWDNHLNVLNTKKNTHYTTPKLNINANHTKNTLGIIHDNNNNKKKNRYSNIYDEDYILKRVNSVESEYDQLQSPVSSNMNSYIINNNYNEDNSQNGSPQQLEHQYYGSSPYV